MRGVRAIDLGGLAVGVFGFVALAYLTVPAVDPDYGWHVANGRHLLDGVLFAGVDIYSWTAHGATWIAHEWLTEGTMAFLHDSLGPTANSVVAGVLATLALLATIARLRRRGFGPIGAIVVGVIALLDVGTLASVGPAAVEILAVALLLWLLDEWRAGALNDRAITVAVLLLMLIWANAHGSFVLGLGILGVTWIGLVAERSRRARLALALAVAGSLVTLVNPFGIRLWTYVAGAITGSRLQLITEWAPPDLGDRMWWAFVAALALAVIGAVGWLARPRRPGPGTLRFDDILVVVALAVAGLAHARHAGIFGIGAAPAIAAGTVVLGAAGRAAAAWLVPLTTRRSPASIPRLNAAVLAIVGVLALVLVGARVGPSNTAAAVRAEYPVDALPALDRLACGRPQDLHLFNDYAWGGWLEMTRPAIPVYIDGRSEVYGDAQVARYAAIQALAPGWQATLDASGAQSALLRTGSPLAAALPAIGWDVAFHDDVAVLLARPGRVDMNAGGC